MMGNVRIDAEFSRGANWGGPTIWSSSKGIEMSSTLPNRGNLQSADGSDAADTVVGESVGQQLVGSTESVPKQRVCTCQSKLTLILMGIIVSYNQIQMFAHSTICI